MKAINSIIGVFLALSFMMGVYCAGTNKTYDFKTHLESIATVSEEMPSLEELSYIWTADIIENGQMTSGPAGLERETVHLKRWPTYGIFEAAYDDSDGTYWYSFVRAGRSGGTVDANKYWEPVSDFLDGTLELMGRTGYTFIWLGNYVVSFLELALALSPTSGIVERG